MHAYAHMRNRTFPFLRVCAFTHLHIWVDTAQDAGAGPRWMTMEGWHMGRKESAGNQAGTARMTVVSSFSISPAESTPYHGSMAVEVKEPAGRIVS